MRVAWTALLSTAALIGCGPPAPKTGAVQLRFTVADSVRSNPSLKDPLVGTAYGDIYLVEDVGIAGPRDTTNPVVSMPATAIDLRSSTVSEVAVTLDKLEPNTYVFLGFFDLDDNAGAVEKRPEAGDPATLPRTNEFTITAGTETKRLVVYDLLYN